MAYPTEWTPKKREIFLKSLGKGASVTAAAAAARVSRSHLYDLRKADEEFASEWDSAVECGTDELEDEALRRAKTGTLKPVFYKGDKCGLIREYSDTLLIFLLKARRPEKYKERGAVEVTGKDGGDLKVSVVRVPAKRSREEWQNEADAM